MTMSNEEFTARTGLQPLDAALMDQMKTLIVQQMADLPDERRAAMIAEMSPAQRRILYSIGMPQDLADTAALSEWLAS